MAENMAARKLRGVQRVLEKLQSSVNAGNYYEAHQMYKTLYFRYLAQKRYADLLDMLNDGALLLLRHDQQTSGADLANLFVDVLAKSEMPASEERLNKLALLFGSIKPEVTERETFLHNALRWSTTGSQEYKSGHPILHQLVARVFWREHNYMWARYHFLHSMDGCGFATMLIELHRTRGFASEVDLFIAQVVLQYLCLQNQRTATVAFQTYTTKHPSIDKGPPYILPLLNFIWFLLETVQGGKLTTFTVLCKNYEGSIRRDPTYTGYLDKIGQIFFGVPPPRPCSEPGFLDNIFQSLMNGLGDYESEGEEPANIRPSTSRHNMEALD